MNLQKATRRVLCDEVFDSTEKMVGRTPNPGNERCPKCASHTWIWLSRWISNKVKDYEDKIKAV